jgi:hypothetical protein
MADIIVAVAAANGEWLSLTDGFCSRHATRAIAATTWVVASNFGKNEEQKRRTLPSVRGRSMALPRRVRCSSIGRVVMEAHALQPSSQSAAATSAILARGRFAISSRRTAHCDLHATVSAAPCDEPLALAHSSRMARFHWWMIHVRNFHQLASRMSSDAFTITGQTTRDWWDQHWQDTRFKLVPSGSHSASHGMPAEA